MSWTRLPFGKYQGMTLPQVIAVDLDWFFHMQPRLYAALGFEACMLMRRLCSVKIPRHLRRRAIEYYHDGKEFAGFSFVKAKTPMTVRGAHRLSYLDMSLARGGRQFAKRECEKMIRCFRNCYFGKRKNLTKRRIEKFFSRRANFINP
jgi:hypothetical protein